MAELPSVSARSAAAINKKKTFHWTLQFVMKTLMRSDLNDFFYPLRSRRMPLKHDLYNSNFEAALFALLFIFLSKY